jgi:hypothetical protein
MRSPGPDSLTQMMLQRLERVSVDSYWAHRASGVRGALLRSLERQEAGNAVDEGELRQVIQLAFEILEQAAPVGRKNVRSPARAGSFGQLRE